MNRAVGGLWLAWEETAGTRCRGSCLRVPASGAALSITALVAGVESISNDGQRTEQINNGGCSECFRTGTFEFFALVRCFRPWNGMEQQRARRHSGCFPRRCRVPSAACGMSGIGLKHRTKALTALCQRAVSPLAVPEQRKVCLHPRLPGARRVPPAR